MAGRKSHIPNSLKKYRRISGYSQKKAVRLLGFKSTSRISRWERGLSMPSVENLLKLSFLYSTLPAELYEELWKSVKDELHPRKSKIDT